MISVILQVISRAEIFCKMKKYKFAKIVARPFPSLADLSNPYIFGGIDTVINVSEREEKEHMQVYRLRGIAYHYFPLKEGGVDMGWENVKRAVEVILHNIDENNSIFIHCTGGNNRSRMVVECVYFALFGEHLNDEYRGSCNHLIYNVENKYLPLTLDAIEKELILLK